MSIPTTKFRIEGEDATAAAFRSALGNAQGTANKIQGAFKSAFIGLSVAGVAAGLTSIVSRSIEVGDELNKAAIKAGINGRAMSELAHAAKMADIDLSSLSTGLKKMQVVMSEAASGGKEQQQSLAALGLTISDIKNLAADKQFELIADRISQLKSPADKSRAAVEFLGKAGAEMLPMFEQGAAGIRAAREEAVKLGKSLGDDQIKRLADADDAIKHMKASWESLGIALTLKVLKPLTAIMDLMHGKAPGVSDDPVKRRMDQLKKEIADYKDFDPSNVREGLRASAVARVAAELNKANAEYLKLASLTAVDKASGAAPPPGFEQAEKDRAAAALAAKQRFAGLSDVVVAAQKSWMSPMVAYYDQLDERTRTSTENQIRQLDETEAALNELRDAGKISADTYRERWEAALDDVLGEVKVTAQKMGKPLEEFPNRAKEFAESARYDFNEFFFDPVDKGIKGLAKSLLDSMRHSLADIATDKLFGSKASGGFGWESAIGSGIGKLFAGFRADGGDVHGGKSYIVGERGPELFTPGSSGGITPNNRLGGSTAVNIYYNVDARGADIGLTKALPGILKAHGDGVKNDIINGIRRGKYPV